MGLEIQILAWDRYKNVAGLKQFIRSQSSHTDVALCLRFRVLFHLQVRIISHSLSYFLNLLEVSVMIVLS
jgi:hypothetical protein